MKAMGFNHLFLVAPKKFPAAAATAMASGADDLLADAQIVNTLEEALRDCTLVFGTTARGRHLEWPVMSPREAAVEMRVAVETGPVAFVFGREQAGLTNAELDLCQRAIRIPTEAHFNSLNLAQASDPIASASALERLHSHFIDTMEAVSYLDPSNPRLLQRRLRRLLIGANMRQSESQILRGFLTAIERTLKRLGQPSDKTE
jgi:tRNA C32,U32 (ribose-2'-O)-methylase TrmJ